MDTDISGSGKWHTETTETTENVNIKRDNICEIREFCVRLKGYTARKPQKRVASREIISVRSVKSVWDLKLRFAQVFEDERNLLGCEASLVLIISRLS